jgi:SAM-dependent methyltransferase
MNNGCCGSSNDSVRKTVRSAYGEIAKTPGPCGSFPSCCGSASPDALAKGIGYSSKDLASIPEGANLGLSCGNPTALASLKEGEIVLDLGAGAGFDAFIAARAVGPTGRVIGVDMTPEMVERARANAACFKDSSGLDNVEFRLGEIEHLPAGDGTVDVILSNCVINLSPDKVLVWKEAFRVLKPNGRISVSDLALLRTLPDALRSSVEALVGCVAGAVLVDDTRRLLTKAGFVDIELTSKAGKIDSMADWSDPLYRNLEDLLKPGEKMSDYVTSLEIAARKPG